MCFTRVTVVRSLLRRSCFLWRAPQKTDLLRFSHTHTKFRPSSKPSAIHGTLLLGFSFPTLFKKSSRLTRDDIASVDLADIPKEVYIDDLNTKSKQKQWMLTVILYKMWSSMRLCLRAGRLVLTFTPFVFTYPITYLSDGFHRVWLKGLLFVCERSGPTLVKFGQWASTRRDLFSKEFCDRFSKLHRRTEPHSWYYTRQKLEKAFGKNWKHVLVRIDDKNTPLGSGCVAQVYKAYMPSEMVVDDDVLEAILADIDDHTNDDQDSDEILGFGHFLSRFSSDTDHDKPDERPTLSFSKRKQHVPALSSKSQKEAEEERRRLEREAMEREGVEGEMSDIDVAIQDGLVPVAVKVLHPGIYRAVQRDLLILRLVAGLFEILFPRLRWLSLSECVEEFADIMERQIDLRHEAECLEKFYENFEHIPTVRFPRPVRPFVKRNVLVETFEEGEPISQYLTDVQENVNSDLALKLADIGAEALLQMIFIDNFIHGDLHPGNIFVQNAQDFNSQEEGKLTLVDICDTTVVNVRPPDLSLRLVLLDVGITSSLTDQDRQAFRDVFKAVVLGRGEEAGALMLDHARKHECTNRAQFQKDIASIVTVARERSIKLGKIQVADLLSNVFGVLSRHKVKLESNFLSVILAIMVLEGLGRSLDPDMDILEKARPVLLTAS